MGRQARAQVPFKVSPKKMRGSQECMEEMGAFFTCMARFTDVEDKCASERRALTNCATAAARRAKPANTLNYHLQRLSRMIRR